MIFIGFILSFADYLMMPPNPPVAVIFACCATPSPKFLPVYFSLIMRNINSMNIVAVRNTNSIFF